MIEIRKINHDNFHQVLNLKVTDEQKEMIEPITYRLAKSYVNITNNENPPIIFAIYHQEDLVGYVDMGLYDVWEESLLAKKYGDKVTYGINSFLIDQAYQNKGLGKLAMKKIIDYLKSHPQGKADAITISYWYPNQAARKLYANLGFEETGAIWDGNTFEDWNPERTDMEMAEVGARLAL